jgi:hypothetical protein
METSINLLQTTNITNTTRSTRQTIYIEVRETITDKAIYVEITGEVFEGDQAPKAETTIYVRRNTISIVSKTTS